MLTFQHPPKQLAYFNSILQMIASLDDGLAKKKKSLAYSIIIVSDAILKGRQDTRV